MLIRDALLPLTALAVSLALVGLPGTATGDTGQQCVAEVEATEVTGDWVFEGCLSYFPAGRCFDVYRFDGGYWRCAQCGETGAPSTDSCTPLSDWVLENGYWCL